MERKSTGYENTITQAEIRERAGTGEKRQSKGFAPDELRGISALGDMVRRERMKQGLSQNDLGKKSGLSQTAISMIEIGVNNPFHDTRQKLANALGIPVTDLYIAAGEIPSDDVKKHRRRR